MKKIIVNSALLAQALERCGAFINAKSVLPVIQNFYIEVTSAEMKITTTDLHMGITESVPCEATGSFSFIAPVLFQKTVSSLVAQSIVITVEDTKLSIAASEGVFDIALIATQDFPTPQKELGKEIIVPSKELLKTIDAIAFASSTDQFEGGLTAIRFGDKHIIGTDGKSSAWSKWGHTVNRSVPNYFCVLMLKVLNGINTPLALNFGNNVVKIDVNSKKIMLWARMIDTEFPNWKTVIKTHAKEEGVKCILTRKLAIEHLSRLLMYADDEYNSIAFDLADGLLNFRSQSNTGNAAKTQPIGDVEGVWGKDHIYFDAKRLLKILKKIKDDKVVFWTRSNLEPMYFPGEDSYFLMPLRF